MIDCRFELPRDVDHILCFFTDEPGDSELGRQTTVVAIDGFKWSEEGLVHTIPIRLEAFWVVGRRESIRDSQLQVRAREFELDMVSKITWKLESRRPGFGGCLTLGGPSAGYLQI